MVSLVVKLILKYKNIKGLFWCPFISLFVELYARHPVILLDLHVCNKTAEQVQLPGE